MTPTENATSGASKRRILIVEDEKPLSHALELKLGSCGYETVVAATGAEGLKLAAEGKFELILLDLILPEMDGFTMLEQLRGKKVSTPVIVLSNLGQNEDRKRVEAFDIKQYCVKSNTPLSTIVDIVKSLLPA